MLWVNASSVLMLLVAALTFYFVCRRSCAAFVLQRQLEIKLSELKSLLTAAHDATARLEAALKRAELPPAPQPPGTLAAIESLADPTALADTQSLFHVAAQLPTKPTDVVADIFEQDKKTLTVSRLCDQGLKPDEISRRLSLPIGEVEFLLSLRPVSQA